MTDELGLLGSARSRRIDYDGLDVSPITKAEGRGTEMIGAQEMRQLNGSPQEVDLMAHDVKFTEDDDQSSVTASKIECGVSQRIGMGETYEEMSRAKIDADLTQNLSS